MRKDNRWIFRLFVLFGTVEKGKQIQKSDSYTWTNITRDLIRSSNFRADIPSSICNLYAFLLDVTAAILLLVPNAWNNVKSC
jgi:hypothetical protein